MSSNESYIIEQLQTIVINIYRYGNLIIYIIGNIGNLLSFLVFMKRSWRKNVCVFYFLICLILNSLYINSVILATMCIIGFNINYQNSSLLLCKLLYYSAFLFSTLFPTVHILASIDRLLISSQNVNTRLYSSKRLAYFSVSLATIFWFIWNIHALIKIDLQQYDIDYTVCYYEYSYLYFYFITYSLMIFNCLFCLLMIILSILSFKNIRHIRIIPRSQRKGIRSMTKKDLQLLRCLYVQNIVYISVSILPTIYPIYKIITENHLRTNLQIAIRQFLDDLFSFFYYTYYASNFTIFFFVSKAFRLEIRRSIHRICFSKNNPIPQQQENHFELHTEIGISAI